jgi:catechol 2,3-dioxygenase-like lactoylglutathione lyase family enzyme
MPRIERVSIISVPVTDQQKAKEFYENILGFEVRTDAPMSDTARWIELAPAGAETSITLVTWFDWLKPGSIGGNVLKVDDIQRVRDDLVSKGVEVSIIDPQPWGQFANFKDPDGNGWILMGEPG